MNIPLSSNFFGMMQLEEYYDELIDGFMMTMGLYMFALVFGFILGIGLAILRQYGGRISSRIATGYVEVIRGTPLLTQVFVVYFGPLALNAFLESNGLPPVFEDWQVLGPDWWGGTKIIISSRILLGALALALNSAAYQAEYFRGSMGSISSGQIQAAVALGMTRQQSIRHIILPQTLRRVIPAWSNEAAYLPKYTTVVSFIAIEELFNVGSWIVGRTFLVFEVYAIIAVVFLVLISVVSFILDRVYDKIKIPGL